MPHAFISLAEVVESPVQQILRLEYSVYSLGHGIVIAVPRFSHARLYSCLFEQYCIHFTAILKPSVGMVNQSFWIRALPDGDFQGLNSPSCFKSIPRKPPNHFSSPWVCDHEQITESFPHQDVGNVTDPTIDAELSISWRCNDP